MKTKQQIKTFCEHGVTYDLDGDAEIKIGDLAYSPQSDAIMGIDEENIDYANEEYLLAKPRPQLIEANNKCLTFKGDAIQAIFFVDYMTEFLKEPRVEYNLISDFLYNIEVELQNNGYLDEHFNLTNKCLS